MSFTFDPESHSYRLNGAVLPSVTTVIRSIVPGWDVGDYFLQRGRATHHGCHLLDAGTLDHETVAEEIRPRINAWAKFRADFPAEIVASEVPHAHPLFRYAGTVDRILKDARGDLIVADLKNSISCHVIPQLGAYSLVWIANHSKQLIRKAVAVELNENGTYRCQWLTTPELRRAEQTFLAMLTVYGFLKMHGIPTLTQPR